jgi:hypothetical protein
MSSTLAAGAVASPDGAAFAVSSGAAGVAAPEVPAGDGLFAGGAGGAAFGGVLPDGEVDDDAPDCCVAPGGAPFAPGC